MQEHENKRNSNMELAAPNAEGMSGRNRFAQPSPRGKVLRKIDVGIVSTLIFI